MLQILLTILFSSFKFAATFPLVILQFNFSFLETILWTNVGGMAGIYFFAFLSGKLLAWWNRNFRKTRHDAPAKQKPTKKVFSRKTRRMVKIKKRYGLAGIALSTPFLLSIPVGVFLVVRYYRASRAKYLYLIASNVIWSFIYAAFYMFWDGLLFKKA